MKMFWNKDPLDRDPWETQPEDNVKKLTTSQIVDIVFAIVAVLLVGLIAYDVYTDYCSTKNPMRDPAYSGNASVGTGANLDDDGADQMQMQSPVCKSLNYSFARVNDQQYACLLHFVDTDGNTLLCDLWVFFNPGCNIKITYPNLEGYITTAKGLITYFPCEKTVVYYKDSEPVKTTNDYVYATWGDDISTAGVQPDGYTFEVPTCDIPEHEGKCIVDPDGTICHFQPTAPEKSGYSAYQTVCTYGTKPSLQTLRDAGVVEVFYSDDIGESWHHISDGQIGIKNISLEDTWYHKVTEDDLDPAKVLYTDLSLSMRFVEYDSKLYLISEIGDCCQIDADSWGKYLADAKAGKTTGINLAACEPGCPADDGLNSSMPISK